MQELKAGDGTTATSFKKVLRNSEAEQLAVTYAPPKGREFAVLLLGDVEKGLVHFDVDQMLAELGYTPKIIGVLAEVKAEREKQIKKGFSARQDDCYTSDQLIHAALSYAQYAGTHHEHINVPYCWPWAELYFKSEGRRADLIKAAALLVAEIERMDRAEKGNEHA